MNRKFVFIEYSQVVKTVETKNGLALKHTNYLTLIWVGFLSVRFQVGVGGKITSPV